MRIEQLTFTRFVAAMAIVVYHFGDFVFPFEYPLLSLLIDKANVGVSYFFILSGFVMVVAYANRPQVKWTDYMVNRLARIYPVYLLAIVLLLFYSIGFGKAFDVVALLLNVLMIQSYFPGYALSFNFPGWSIAVEFLFYALFPIMYNRFFSKLSYTKLVLPISAIWLGSQLFVHWFVLTDMYEPFPSKINEFTYFFPLWHVNEFLIGNLMGLLFTQKLFRKQGRYDWYILGLLVLLVLVIKFVPQLFYHNGGYAMLFAPLILLLAMNNGWLTKLFSNKLLVVLGEVSFGIYILQLPVFLIFREVLNHLDIQNPSLRFYLNCSALISISTLSFYFFETPVRNKIKKTFLKA